MLSQGQAQTGVASMGLGVRLWLACLGELFPWNYLVRTRTLILGILTSTKPLQKYKNHLTSFSLFPFL